LFYKPSYCCNCGEKIERPNPSFTDSGRFCDVCQTDFVVKERLPQIFVVLMAIVGIFGLGSYWRGGEKPLNVSTKQVLTNSAVANKTSVNQTAQANSNSTVPQLTQTNNVQANKLVALQSKNLTSKPSGKQESAPLSTEEMTYFCGAPTKKGTPCSRRVKGGGRCWQHKGQNAMLPPEKLVASQ
jgi:hypothetical protein